MKNISIIILAAGKGSRMQSSIPKPMHKIGNKTIIEHAINNVNELIKNVKIKCQTIIVQAPEQNELKNITQKYNATPIIQNEQKGTAHAILQCNDEIKNADALLVLFADTPFVSQTLMKNLINTINKETPIAIAGFKTEKPNAYGRIILKNNKPTKIIEAKDATPKEQKIKLCNGGIMAIHKSALNLLTKIDNKNKQNEYLLPHIVNIATKENMQTAIIIGEEQDFIGVNSPKDLAECEAIFQNHMRQKFLENGVRMIDPQTVYFSADTKIEANVDIEPYVIFGNNVTIKSGTHIYGFSHISGANIGNNVSIGPYARIRPETQIGDGCKIGNFVEVKNSILDNESKASHLSYIGDSNIGTKVNIGAGVITCNYDGVNKHRTQIGDSSMIGANVSLIAPVNIGSNALIGAGSVITANVADGDVAVSRSEQVMKPSKE